MYIKIHRGSEQIGGNIVEIGTANTKIIFDCGANLPPLDVDCSDSTDNIEIDGLTYGIPSYDGVFISHHHSDHCGLIQKILPNIPVYSGHETQRILNVVGDFTYKDRPNIKENFINCKSVQIKDIKITPIGVDHSAYDAYMFLIQSDGKAVLYTGDYRAVEDTTDAIRRLIGSLAVVDVIISEGTNIRAYAHEDKIGKTIKSEEHIQQAAEEIFNSHAGTIFVLCSSTNKERINSIAKAAMNKDRLACEDLFQTVLRNDKADNVLRFIAHRVDGNKNPNIYQYFKSYYEERKLVGAKSLTDIKGKKVVFVRTSMIKFISDYLSYCSDDDNVLIYSMWDGYKSTKSMQKFLSFCIESNMNLYDLHCSGHAYMNGIHRFLQELSPKAVIPIHCSKNDRHYFNKLHSNCLMLEDGEIFTLV